MAMVQLEKIVEDDEMARKGRELRGELPDELPELPEDMLADDALRLRILIARHLRYTGSGPGQTVLDEWEKYLPKFVKVMPTEYRKVLSEQRR